MNNDIAKDAAEEFRVFRGMRGWDQESTAEAKLVALIEEAIQRATAADKERIAELEAVLNNVTIDEQSLGGIRIVWREDTKRHEAYDANGDFLWSGDPIFNIWRAIRETDARKTAQNERDQLRAQLAAKTQECEGLRDDGDLLWKVRKMIARLLVVHTPHLTDDRLVEVIDRMTAGGASLRNRITEYLCVGGLFNPEAMEHDKVRDLLMDVRNYLDSARKEGE